MEMDFYAALGVEKPKEETPEVKGSTEQVVAEPAAEDLGSNELEPAEPVDKEENTDVEPPKQSPEENAKYQAARKDAEVKAAAKIAAAEAKVQAEIDKFYSLQNLTNPYKDDAPITTKAEYDEFQRVERERELKRAGVNPEIINSIVDDKFSRYQLEAEQIKVQAEIEAQRITKEAEFKIKADQELAEIHKLDPSISSIKDIVSQPYADEFRAKVEKGYSFLDAFKAVNMEAIIQREVLAASQAASNKAASKQHLSTISDRGGKTDSLVPPEVKQAYRAINRDASDDEIQKHWNNDQKKLRGG